MKGITRRQVLESLGLAIGSATLAAACNDGHPGGKQGPDAGAGTQGAPDLAAGSDLSAPRDLATASDLATARDAAAGRDAASAPDMAVSDQQLLASIDTIVVLMMENRSFDHYLGSLALAEGKPFDGLTGNEWNPDPSGNKVYVAPLPNLTPADPPHDWDPAHQQWDNGANDGFVIAHAGADQNDVMGYYMRSQLPVTYALADQSAVCQRWFSSLLGPTWPNRMFLHCATSNGVTTNVPSLGSPSIFDSLDTAGISNKNYYSDIAWASGGYLKTTGLDTIESYFSDAAAGTLPSFSTIDPMFLGAMANDDHPSHDVTLGQTLISTVFAALAASPQWSRSLFVLVYDENGGFFDHVPPPATTDERTEFQQLGFRVPTLVAGPCVKRGAIDTVFDHVSVAATVAARWGLPPLNARTAAANTLASCIDPNLLGKPQAPPTLPLLKIRRSRIGNRPAYAGEHPELVNALERGHIPRRLDRRGQARAITERILAEGVRLGTVHLLD
ncbi:MAG TPA: alkaline phosphatase family protein [Polyangia bacterium]|nr:alkaline phosphatase family protein [Polyangia bacterium]